MSPPVLLLVAALLPGLLGTLGADDPEGLLDPEGLVQDPRVPRALQAPHGVEAAVWIGGLGLATEGTCAGLDPLDGAWRACVESRIQTLSGRGGDAPLALGLRSAPAACAPAPSWEPRAPCAAPPPPDDPAPRAAKQAQPPPAPPPEPAKQEPQPDVGQALGGVVAGAAAPAAAAAGVALLPWDRLGRRLRTAPHRLLSVVGALALYSRSERDGLLENPTRQRIHETVGQRPGASIQSIRGELEIAWGTAVYHLDRLERHGLVVSHRQGNHRRYFVAGSPEARDRVPLAVLEAATARRLAQAVMARPGTTQTDLCEKLGIRHPVASKYLRRLEQHRLVRSEARQRYRCYHPTPELRDLAPRAWSLDGRAARRPPRPGQSAKEAAASDDAADPFK